MARTIGDQELELFKHVAERGACSAGEVADAFGGPRGLSRTTVVTVLERLRAKGFVRRRRVGGLYRYVAARAPAQAMLGAVRAFVERTPGGGGGERELEELKAMLARLRRSS